MAKATSNGKPPTKIDELVGYFISIRDEIERKKAEHKEELKPLSDMLDELEGRLRAALDDSGAESIRTDLGTVYITIHDSFKAEDPDKFMRYIERTGFIYLLDRRPNKTACREFVEENDTLPPGISHTSIRKAQVRNPTP